MAPQGNLPRFFPAFGAAVLALLGALSPAFAARPPEVAALPDFDHRPSAVPAVAGAARERAAGDLRARVAGVKVADEARTGAPRLIASTRAFLTGPAGEGRAVPTARARAQAAGESDAVRGLKGLLDEYRGLFGHGAEALARARPRRDDTNAKSGLRTMVWEQQVEGVPVFGALLQAHATRKGELVNVGSHFLPDPTAAAERGTPRRAARMAAPKVSAAEAVAVAARSLGETTQAADLMLAEGATGPEKRQRFHGPGVREATVQFSWLPLDSATLRLCWQVVLVSAARGEMFRVLVDAETGEPLLRHGLTHYLSEASYRVFTGDSPTPFSPGHAAPLSGQAAEVARTLVTTAALDPVASPAGWIGDGENQTLGNNVDAHLDLNADDLADLPRPTGSPFRVFDFALDLTQSPSSYRSAAVVQLFFWCNWMHDRLYQLGFTEAAGNFQVDNFGRGGVGGDAVQADAQDGSGTNNANFSAPPDGIAGRMQMYLFPGPEPDRDGDLDAEIILHEYTHGLSGRLVGGGAGISAPATRGMGEGWSDFYALALLSQPADDPNGNYAMGGYATHQLGGLTQNYYFGIRRYPYTTDLAKNPLTLRDIDPAQHSEHAGIPRSPIFANTADEIHNMGEVWCVTLWGARASLIAKHGAAAGNELILQLVTDGMKLAPANPNFLEARDAILQADRVNTGGANAAELWAAFAKRGMGESADCPASATTVGVVEAFDLPDDLTVTPRAAFTGSGPVGGPFLNAARTFTLTNAGTAPLAWTASTGLNWLTLAPASGSLLPGASATVTATVNASAAALAAGVFSGTVTLQNLNSGRAQSRSVTLAVGQPDYFTELFDTTPLDLAHSTFTFTPNGSASFYKVTRDPAASFPTDPAGGTVLSLTDDSAIQVTLSGGKKVSLYGVSYSSFFFGSNGYVTFGLSDLEYAESFAAHFLRPRIAALFRDLDPPEGGTYSWRQLADRAVATYQNVSEYGTGNANSFQIEMFFDGRLRITLLDLDATRGLVGLSRGAGVAAGFTESDFSSYPPSAFLSVTLPASAPESAGLLATPGTVALSAAQPAAVTVTLAAGDPTEVSVPPSVVIPAGQVSATFPITVLDDPLLDGTQTVAITASAPAFASGSATLEVLDDEAATLSITAPATATEGAGTVPVVIHLSSAPAKAVTVQLRTSDASELLPPPTVVLPAGQTSATVAVAIVNDDAIDGPQSATLTASVAGWTSGSALLTVLDDEATALAVTLPPAVPEGGTGIGRVFLSGAYPTAIVVALSSSDPAQLAVPPSVMLPAGQTSASFLVTGVDDVLADGAQTVSVSATAPGFTSAAASTRVTDNEVDHFKIAPIGPAQIRNTPFNVTITARDRDDVLIPTDSSLVRFSAPIGLAPASAQLSSGIWTGALSAAEFGNGIVLTATDSAGHSGASNAFDVTFGPLHHFAWSPFSAAQLVNLPFPVTLTAQDAAGNSVLDFTGSASLDAGRGAVTTGSGSTEWDQPLHTFYHDSRTQILYLPGELGGAGQIAGLSLFVTKAPGQTMNAFTIRLKHSALTSYGPGAAWESTGWTTVHQSTQTITQTGWVTFLFSAPFAYNGTSSLLVDFTFNNASYTESGTCRATTSAVPRALFYYTDSGFGDPLAWSGSSSPTPNLSTLVPNLRLEFARTAPVSPLLTGAFQNGAWTGAVTLGQIASGLTLRATVSGSVAESAAFHVAGWPLLSVTPGAGVTATGNTGGPFSPAPAGYTLTNSGTAPLAWTAASDAPWLNLSATSGTLTPGASTSVAATLAAAALEPGSRTAALTFSNTTNGLGSTTRSFTLEVTLAAPVFAPLPPLTGGPANTLSWSSVPAAEAYEVQRSATAGFAAAVSSGWLHATTATFTGLPDGKFFYRVRARHMTADGFATLSPWSAVVFSVQSASDTDFDGLPDTWEMQHGLDRLSATGPDGALGNRSGDGVPNLLKYALNLDPEAVATAGLPFTSVESDAPGGPSYLTFHYLRRLAPGALEYRVEASSDARTWTSSTADFLELPPALPQADGVAEWVTIRLFPALETAGTPTRFVRLRVLLP